MFEYKQGNKYLPYDKKVNPDIYTWRIYNDTQLVENHHQLLELQFNLTDATLQGTEDHIERMTEVISRYQIRINRELMEADAYAKCLEQAACASLISESKAKITNDLIAKIYEGYQKMTPTQKAQAKSDSDSIFDLAASNTMKDYLSLMKSYYLEYIPA